MSKLVNILLQKSQPEYPWGFSLGCDSAARPIIHITWVDEKSLASEYIEVGDRVLEIEGMDTSFLSNAEVVSLLNNPSKKMELLIMKKNKLRKNDRDSLYEQEKNKCTEQERSKQILKCDNLVKESIQLKKSEEVDKFWTRPPADLEENIIKQTFMNRNLNIKKEFNKHMSNEREFITESMIFNSFNNFNNKNKIDDPREEKRKFWENCSKNESVRRFKWGDNVKAGRLNCQDGTSVRSVENLYDKKDIEEILVNRRIERSKSCEPEGNMKMETNPFILYDLPCRQYGSNNPFLFHNSITNESMELIEKTADIESKNIFYPSFKETTSKEDFNTKCEFFERATSVPITCDKNAKDLVQEHFKEISNSCQNYNCDWPSTQQSIQPDKEIPKIIISPPPPEIPARKEALRYSPNNDIFKTHSNLKKPSDFINLQQNQFKTTILGPVDVETESQGKLSSNSETEIYEYHEENESSIFKKTSSFHEKLTREKESIYNKNVETSLCRKQELLTAANCRSSTPYGFYDNNFEKMYQENNCNNSSVNIVPESFEQLRTKLATLLGGKPIVWKKMPTVSDNNYSYARSEVAVEEAFEELAVKEGLFDEYPEYLCYRDHCKRQSSQIAGSNGAGGPHPGQYEQVYQGVPPPPPPPAPGNAPPIRIASEIGPSKKCYEPPAAIQNAMMTKDKKPFTYTPGGLDLAEIRSPRMARRINRNAHMEDSCSGAPVKSLGPGQHYSMPPAAMATLQPQLAIPVLPSVPDSLSGAAPPPPPPFPTGVAAAGGISPQFTSPPPPPPPMPEANQQLQKQKNGNHSPPSYLQDIQARPALRPVSQTGGQPRPPPDFVSEIPCHSPLKPINHPPRSSYEPSNTSQIQVQLKPVSPKSVTPQNSVPPYIPQPSQTTIQSKNSPSQQSEYQNQTNTQTPKLFNQDPIQQKPVHPPKPNVYIPTNQPSPSNVTPIRQTPPSPVPLNKSPAPWMVSKQVQKETPPWTVKQGTPEEKEISPPTGAPVTRMIPIQIEGREPTPSYQQQMAQQMQIQMQNHFQMQQQMNQSAIPQQFSPPVNKQNNFMTQESAQGRTRIIPIQIEGGESSINQQNINPINYATGNGQNQNIFRNSPQSGDGLQRTSSVDAADGRSRQLQSQISWTPPGSNPIQSRSFRVLQKITGSEDHPPESINQSPIGEIYLVNRVLPDSQGRLDESEY